MSTVADELLRQFAQTAEDGLSAILTTQDLEDFQKEITKSKRKGSYRVSGSRFSGCTLKEKGLLAVCCGFQPDI